MPVADSTSASAANAVRIHVCNARAAANSPSCLSAVATYQITAPGTADAINCLIVGAAESGVIPGFVRTNRSARPDGAGTYGPKYSGIVLRSRPERCMSATTPTISYQYVLFVGSMQNRLPIGSSEGKKRRAKASFTTTGSGMA